MERNGAGAARSEPKQRGILFSGTSVRKILSDDQTQTRRPVSGTKMSPVSGLDDLDSPLATDIHVTPDGQTVRCTWRAGRLNIPVRRGYAVGDLLYVRECFAVEDLGDDGPRIVFRADRRAWWLYGETMAEPHYLDMDYKPARWRPGIHMPKRYARIWLEITEVRVERLQSISPRDAWAEGARCSCTKPVPMCRGNVDAFAKLVDKTCGVGTWERNDWQRALTFKRIEAPS